MVKQVKQVTICDMCERRKREKEKHGRGVRVREIEMGKGRAPEAKEVKVRAREEFKRVVVRIRQCALAGLGRWTMHQRNLACSTRCLSIIPGGWLLRVEGGFGRGGLGGKEGRVNVLLCC